MANRVTGGSKTRYKKSQGASGENAPTDLLERPEALSESFDKSKDFLEKNQKPILGIALVILLIAGGFFGYRYYLNNQNVLAQEEMFQAVFYFDNGEYEKALSGDGNNFGFLDIITEYGGTKAANLANYYVGVIYLEQENYESAINYLSNFSSSDLLVQAEAYALTGDAHVQLEQYEEAARMYEKAANHNANKFFTPVYLMKAAMAYRDAGSNREAIDCYSQIITNYPTSSEVDSAKKYKALLERA